MTRARARWAAALGLLLVINTLSGDRLCWAAPATSSDTTVPPFAVVELFTSEGCASCPSADWLLGRILAEALRRHERLFPLAFHVDYWNSHGWTDPFSDPQSTRRQQAYAQIFPARGVYTPQMVVNGTVEFVGSDWWKARAVLTKAMETPGRVAVTVHVKKLTAGAPLQIHYEIPAAPAGAVLHLALVERGLVQQVVRGENAGRLLHHENVVRLFETVPLSKGGSGEVTLFVPAGVTLARTAVIGYVQDPKTLVILGADGVDVVPAA